jgi:hypothetical protein
MRLQNLDRLFEYQDGRNFSRLRAGNGLEIELLCETSHAAILEVVIGIVAQAEIVACARAKSGATTIAAFLISGTLHIVALRISHLPAIAHR